MLKKQFKLSIDFFGRFNKPKTIEFAYWQASLRELLEMKREFNAPGGQKEWLFDFLMKKTKQSDKLKRKLFDQLGEKQIDSIVDFVLKTYAKDYFEKAKLPKDQTPRKEKLDTSYATICLILEKTSETMESLLNMTWEQIQYILDGTLWNMNAQTKEGQKRNKQKERRVIYDDKATVEDDLKVARDLEKKLKSKKP